MSPYRIDLHDTPADLLERLIDLGALDVEASHDGAVAALMPDRIPPEQLARALGVDHLHVSPAVGRDADSVWILSPRPIQAGRIRIVPIESRQDAHAGPEPEVLRLIDAPAFGTGLHPSTALCLEALDEILQHSTPSSVLDVGTGSGVLALAALLGGVPHARAIDLDADALRVAAENARINGMNDRLKLGQGGPETLTGAWPLVFANVLAAPLIEMAPALVRRIAHEGDLVLSGIASSLEHDVHEAYRRLGMHRVRVRSRDGWVALVLRASW